MRTLLALAEHHRPALVVLDTVSRVVSGKENESDTFMALYRHTGAPLKAAGYTVLRLDHEGKNPEAGQRGSSAKGDDVDTVWRLGARDGLVTLTCERQRSGHHPEKVTLRRHGGERQRLWHERTDPATDDAVSALIRRLDDLGVAPDAGRDVCRRALTEAGVKVGNGDLAEAIRRRKDLSRTGPDPIPPSKIDSGCPEPRSSPENIAGQTCPGQMPDSSDNITSVLEGRPVRRPVTPEGGQAEDGGPDPSRTATTDPGCDECGSLPSVVFATRGVRRCAVHNPLMERTPDA